MPDIAIISLALAAAAIGFGIACVILNILHAKAADNRWKQFGDGDRPAMPHACTQGCNCNPAVVSFASPVPASLHAAAYSTEGQRDHA